MVDGKVTGHLTDTQTTNCSVCGAKPSMMNDLYSVQRRVINENVLDYGLSTMHLHLWIRALEYLWNMAIKLPFEKSRSNKNIAAAIKHKERERTRFSRENSVSNWVNS
eukprot:Pompholyxophrys_punicea_v1_NODE_160_length_3071_cov_7.784151.p1 type:complete len:108 gc:universal NODE_160_length_3071_cov_7.784151:2173-2496(+)